MSSIGIIPARLNASRFPNKPMKLIHGMPMVGHCYHRTALALGNENTFVATCDEEIARYIRSEGGQVIMTSVAHTRAMTRTAEAIQSIEKIANKHLEYVVMVQGDEPLVPPSVIVETVRHLEGSGADIVNVMSRFTKLEDFLDKNNVKVVINQFNDALYFSREPIPSIWKGAENIPMYMQTGIIGFHCEALLRFNSMPESRLEQIESVDMNRILEAGGRIRMLLTESVTIGVDTIDELVFAEKLMENDGVMSEYLNK